MIKYIVIAGIFVCILGFIVAVYIEMAAATEGD